MYFGYFFVTFFLSLILTGVVLVVMERLNIVDRPRRQERKIHTKKIPLGGGLAIFLSFFLVAAMLARTSDLLGSDVTHTHLLALFLGGLVLIIGGIVDDTYALRARYQVWFPIAAALIVIGFGIGPSAISNPLGGMIRLDQWMIVLPGIGTVALLADLLVFVWLMTMMFTTKLLDGLDGLVAGIVAIGALMIFFVSQQPQWRQPEIGLLAIILAAACAGFLVWNFHPAKIFLGQGGSLLTGFLLGSLAIISGSKIATTLLVMGIPMLDVARVIIRRTQKHRSIFSGDSEHLHFQLLHSGMSHRQAVLLLYAIAFLFGLTTLFLQGRQQLIALLLLCILMLVTGVWFSHNDSAPRSSAHQ